MGPSGLPLGEMIPAGDFETFGGAGQQIAEVKCTGESFYEEVNRKYLDADQTQGGDCLRPAPPSADAARPPRDTL